MIDEIRVMSKTGANIFSGKINLETNEVTTSDTDVLFAGFISAILSVSEELQNSDIRELGYQENKIIFTMTENLIFLGFCDSKVPNNDIQVLLDEVIRRWMAKYDDDEYPFVPDEMRQNILEIVKSSILDVFWWASPSFTIKNMTNLISGSYKNPSGSFFVQYLPKSFLLTGVFVFLISLGLSLLTGSAFTGFGAGPASGATAGNVYYVTPINLALFVYGIGLIMKIIYRNQFNFGAFVTLSGIYSVLILLVLVFTSAFYQEFVYLPIAESVSESQLLTYTVLMFLFLAPFNVAYFGYIIFVGYATSFNNNIPSIQYLLSYLISTLFILSVATYIAQGLFGIILAF